MTNEAKITAGELMRRVSIIRGLEIPAGESYFTKVESPSLHELGLASRPHQWSKMRKLQKEFFNAFLGKVTEYETDTLKLFKLPDIGRVRHDALTPEEPSGRFNFTLEMDAKFGRMIKEWMEELLGTEMVKQVDPMSAVYPYYMLNAFSIGLERELEIILRSLPDWIDEEELEKRFIQATLSNRYLRNIVLSGGSRIKTELGRKYLEEVREALRDMAREGKSPIEAARYLHKQIGEGHAWYWNRIARSESALAINAAFFASANQYQVPYQRWSAASAASDTCEVCSYFDGRIWKIEEGPEPVTDTHPHCRCVLEPVYINYENKPIQNPWERPSPYDMPYSRPERELLEQGVSVF